MNISRGAYDILFFSVCTYKKVKTSLKIWRKCFSMRTKLLCHCHRDVSFVHGTLTVLGGRICLEFGRGKNNVRYIN
jgi:hypothetical protein